MTSYIPPSLRGGAVSVQLSLASAFESRVHTISKFLIPTARFAGDTAVTLTDNSFSVRDATLTSVPGSALARLANNTNIATQDATASGKPLIIKVKRDEFTSEILEYGVFNADGTIPGSDGTTAQDAAFDPWDDATARYRINTGTGEIYLNRVTNLSNLVEPGTNNTITAPTGADLTAAGKQTFIVGMVEFTTLQGGALSTAQQEATELSSVIQSLTGILRTINDGKRGALSIIR